MGDVKWFDDDFFLPTGETRIILRFKSFWD